MAIKIIWEKKPKTKKKIIKETRKLKKNIGSTLKWLDIEEIQEKQIVLKRGGKTFYVRGIKLTPTNIFLENEYDQRLRIGRLRAVYNKINFKLYHSFVFNPTNLDNQIAYLSNLLIGEEDVSQQELLQNDIEKALMFIRDYYELEFFVSVQADNEKEIEKRYNELEYQFSRAGFQVAQLNSIDFENYTAYLFENQMINDFLFGRGDFAILEGDNDYE